MAQLPRADARQSSFDRLSERSRRGSLPKIEPSILAVIFVGGVLGGLARYGVTRLWSASAAGFPWATFVVNTGGAFALSLLVVVTTELLAPRRIVRPLLGTGFLGAFTTFSSVVTTTDQLLAHGHADVALAYLGGSLLAGIGAAAAGLVSGRALVAARDGSYG